MKRRSWPPYKPTSEKSPASTLSRVRSGPEPNPATTSRSDEAHRRKTRDQSFRSSHVSSARGTARVWQIVGHRIRDRASRIDPRGFLLVQMRLTTFGARVGFVTVAG